LLFIFDIKIQKQNKESLKVLGKKIIIFFEMNFSYQIMKELSLNKKSMLDPFTKLETGKSMLLKFGLSSNA